MTRHHPMFPPDLDWLPKPPALARDPELALLAVLHTALQTLVFALFASHPQLASTDPPGDAQTLAAHRLIVSVWHFQRQLHRYCRGILDREQRVVDSDHDF